MSDDKPHDGSGLTLQESAERLAEVLSLSPDAAQQLVAELRNALVPARSSRASWRTSDRRVTPTS